MYAWTWEGKPVKFALRARWLLAPVASAVLLLPPGALANSPAGGSADLERAGVGVTLDAGFPAWTIEASVVATLAPPAALVPSDGKMHLVTINGHRLAIWCRGSGSPTVILEHGIGYGVDSDSWEDVQEGVASETRVCRYDRAFVGQSDDAKVGRSMPDPAADLVALTDGGRCIPGPYILVGHSFGGLVVRDFARAASQERRRDGAGGRVADVRRSSASTSAASVSTARRSSASSRLSKQPAGTSRSS